MTSDQLSSPRGNVSIPLVRQGAQQDGRVHLGGHLDDHLHGEGIPLRRKFVHHMDGQRRSLGGGGCGQSGGCGQGGRKWGQEARLLPLKPRGSPGGTYQLGGGGGGDGWVVAGFLLALCSQGATRSHAVALAVGAPLVGNEGCEGGSVLPSLCTVIRHYVPFSDWPPRGDRIHAGGAQMHRTRRDRCIHSNMTATPVFIIFQMSTKDTDGRTSTHRPRYLS